MKAVITKQNGKQSIGRGFSLNELKEAGLNKQDAKKIGIPLDVKRKSLHDENVACIKSHAKKAKAEVAAKPKPETPVAETKPKKKARSPKTKR
jgi:ribosomal protein L13E